MIKSTIRTAFIALALLVLASAISCRGGDEPGASTTETEETDVTTAENTEPTGLTELSDYPDHTAPDPRNPGDIIIYLCSVTDYGAVADGDYTGAAYPNSTAGWAAFWSCSVSATH